MLRRWDAEVVTDEADWDVVSVESLELPVRFHS
jgi:hypothetical protein